MASSSSSTMPRARLRPQDEYSVSMYSTTLSSATTTPNARRGGAAIPQSETTFAPRSGITTTNTHNNNSNNRMGGGNKYGTWSGSASSPSSSSAVMVDGANNARLNGSTPSTPTTPTRRGPLVRLPWDAPKSRVNSAGSAYSSNSSPSSSSSTTTTTSTTASANNSGHGANYGMMQQQQQQQQQQQRNLQTQSLRGPQPQSQRQEQQVLQRRSVVSLPQSSVVTRQSVVTTTPSKSIGSGSESGSGVGGDELEDIYCEVTQHSAVAEPPRQQRARVSATTRPAVTFKSNVSSIERVTQRDTTLNTKALNQPLHKESLLDDHQISPRLDEDESDSLPQRLTRDTRSEELNEPQHNKLKIGGISAENERFAKSGSAPRNIGGTVEKIPPKPSRDSEITEESSSTPLVNKVLPQQPIKAKSLPPPVTPKPPSPPLPQSHSSDNEDLSGSTNGGDGEDLSDPGEGPGMVGPPKELPPEAFLDEEIVLVECGYCGRKFSEERLPKHEQACAKAGTKPRPQYNATVRRLESDALRAYKAAQAHAKDAPPKKPKPKWKEEHEMFINAIRGMKTPPAGHSEASVAPPTTSYIDSSLVQCPHCGRRFNDSVAQRHIPQCRDIGTKPVGGARHTRKPLLLSSKKPSITLQTPSAAPTTTHTNTPIRPSLRSTTIASTPATASAASFQPSYTLATPTKTRPSLPSSIPTTPTQQQTPDGKVPCPHCGRSFEKHAALRHIDICAKVVNKPKPVAKK
ncbi:microtubule-associated protein futsch [Pelomyxa schiedti]|nr:microtubule-associated protein futsch [Pelomyxa schiedti]